MKHLQYELQTGVQQDFLVFCYNTLRKSSLGWNRGDIKKDMIMVIQDVEKMLLEL